MLSVNAFAQTSHTVSMPSGTANYNVPFFWQNEKDGSTAGIIEILPGDAVVWKNADAWIQFVDANSGTQTHTVMWGAYNCNALDIQTDDAEELDDVY